MRLDIRDQLTEGRQPAGTYREVLSGAGEFDLRVIPDFFRRRWRLIAVIVVIMAALAASYAFTATPMYVASTEVLLEPKSDKALDQLLGKGGSGPDSNLGAELIETQIELMQTQRVMRRAAMDEKLDQDPEFNGTMAPSGLMSLISRGIGKAISFFASKGKVGEIDEDDPYFIPSLNLLGSVEILRSGKAYVVVVSVRSRSPVKSARLSTAVARAFIEERGQYRSDAAKQDTQWLSSRLQDLRTELNAAEEAVATFRSQHNLIAPRGDGSTVNEQQLVDLNARLVAAQTETAEKKVKFDQAQRVKESKGNAEAIPEILRSPVIMSLRQQDAELGRKEADLTARYGGSYPQVVNVRAERGNLRGSIQAEMSRILVTLRNDYEVAKAREDQLKASLQQITGQTGADENVMVKLRELERTAAANKSLYEDFLSRAKLTDEQSSLDIRDARIINEALVPWVPSSPKKGLLVTLGIVSGLFLGIGAGVVLEITASGFTAAGQIEEALDLPVLSSIFALRKASPLGNRPASPAFLIVMKPLSRYAESIRAIWSALRTVSGDSLPQIVAVTSAFPKEGKSTTAMSLALSALETSGRVLIIDADLRRPTVAKALGLPAEPGLADLIEGKTGLRDCIRYDSELGISVLTAGRETINPHGLLSSTRMRVLLESLRRHFDVVIIDTPPLGPVSDAVTLSQSVDRIVFVCAWSKTPREAVVSALRKLPAPRKIAGVVLTMVDDRKVSYAGQYGYYGLEQFKSYYKD